MSCSGALEGGRVLRRVLRRGSGKGVLRRHLEGSNTPFQEYDSLGVRPMDTEKRHHSRCCRPVAILVVDLVSLSLAKRIARGPKNGVFGKQCLCAAKKRGGF